MVDESKRADYNDLEDDTPIIPRGAGKRKQPVSADVTNLNSSSKKPKITPKAPAPPTFASSSSSSLSTTSSIEVKVAGSVEKKVTLYRDEAFSFSSPQALHDFLKRNLFIWSDLSSFISTNSGTSSAYTLLVTLSQAFPLPQTKVFMNMRIPPPFVIRDQGTKLFFSTTEVISGMPLMESWYFRLKSCIGVIRGAQVLGIPAFAGDTFECSIGLTPFHKTDRSHTNTEIVNLLGFAGSVIDKSQLNSMDTIRLTSSLVAYLGRPAFAEAAPLAEHLNRLTSKEQMLEVGESLLTQPNAAGILGAEIVGIIASYLKFEEVVNLVEKSKTLGQALSILDRVDSFRLPLILTGAFRDAEGKSVVAAIPLSSESGDVAVMAARSSLTAIRSWGLSTYPSAIQVGDSKTLWVKRGTAPIREMLVSTFSGPGLFRIHNTLLELMVKEVPSTTSSTASSSSSSSVSIGVNAITSTFSDLS